jgi:hypothetical protein
MDSEQTSTLHTVSDLKQLIQKTESRKQVLGQKISHINKRCDVESFILRMKEHL